MDELTKNAIPMYRLLFEGATQNPNPTQRIQYKREKKNKGFTDQTNVNLIPDHRGGTCSCQHQPPTEKGPPASP